MDIELNTEENKWIGTKEAAEHLGLSVQRLADLRSQGKSPKYFKPLGKIMYRKSDLDKWVTNNQ